MRFEYVCRYCKQPVGAVDQALWTYADGAQRLGLHHLDKDHQQEVIQSQQGNSVQVQTVCEQCEQAVNMHPELLIEGSIIQ